MNWLLLLWSWHRNFIFIYYSSLHCLLIVSSQPQHWKAPFLWKENWALIEIFFIESIELRSEEFSWAFFAILSWLLIDNEYLDSRVLRHNGMKRLDGNLKVKRYIKKWYCNFIQGLHVFLAFIYIHLLNNSYMYLFKF